jgi:phosphoribosylglycinamide formyltransferase 1
MPRTRTAILISGRGSNMRVLIEAARDPDFPAEIVLVVANVPDAGGLAYAAEAGITTAIVDHRRLGRDRQAFESALDAVLNDHAIALVCLAGFMRLLTSWFVSRWSERLLNIHPALLPQFKGLDTHRRALEAGVATHGATVHFVVPEMDSGPVIAQGEVAVLKDDTEQALAKRVLEIEHRIYPLALRLVASGEVQVVEGQCRLTASIGNDDARFIPYA